MMKPRASMPSTRSTGDAGEVVGDGVDREAERLGVAQERREVAEHDAGLRVVGDVPDVVREPGGVDCHRFRIGAGSPPHDGPYASVLR